MQKPGWFPKIFYCIKETSLKGYLLWFHLHELEEHLHESHGLIRMGNGVTLKGEYEGGFKSDISVCIPVQVVVTQIYTCVKLHSTIDQKNKLKFNLKKEHNSIQHIFIGSMIRISLLIAMKNLQPSLSYSHRFLYTYEYIHPHSLPLATWFQVAVLFVIIYLHCFKIC